MLSKMNVIMVKHYGTMETIMAAYVAGGTTMLAMVLIHNAVRFAVISLKNYKLAS